MTTDAVFVVVCEPIDCLFCIYKLEVPIRVINGSLCPSLIAEISLNEAEYT